MKRNALGAALAVVGVIMLVAATGETVPQNSPEKYYFTTPKHPGGIKGKVMGDPPAYHIMRSEDIDWLREAAGERVALLKGEMPREGVNLVPEFGKWNMAATNGYVKWTTAKFMENGSAREYVIARYAYRTNDLRGSMRMIKRESAVQIESETRTMGEVTKTVLKGLGIEDPEGNTISGYAVKDWDEEWGKVTNVTEMVVTNWNGTASQTNITYITMPTTNDTVSVHTNRWEEGLPEIKTAIVTNILEKSIYGMMFEDGTVRKYEPESPGNLEGLFRTRKIREWYEVLRKAKHGYYGGRAKIEDEDEECYGRYWPRDEDTGISTTTNTISKGAWGFKSVAAGRSQYNGTRGVYEEREDEWGDKYQELVDIVPKETEESVSGSLKDFVGSGPYVIFTEIPYEVVHTGGVNRIRKGTLFAVVGVSWSRRWQTRIGLLKIIEEGYTNKDYTVVKKIGEATEIDGGVEVVEGTETNRFVGFSCGIEMRNLLEGAAAATGHAFPSYGYGPVLEKECPEAEIDKTGSDPHEWYGGAGAAWTEENYWAGMGGAILLIEFKPWASLQGW